MIHNLCNIVEEENLDIFYKATIIEASQLPRFNHLSRKEDVLALVNSLPENYQAMVVPFIPEKYNLSNTTVKKNGNKIYRTSFSFPLVPQNVNTQNLLETYNNKEVVAFLTRQTHSQLYGTTAQPLIFSYDELHAPTHTGLKGYSLSMSGDAYGAPMYFEGKESDFPVIQRGLAFQLAGPL